MGDMEVLDETASRDAEHLAAIGANCPGIVYRRIAYPDGRIEYPYVSAAVRAIYGLEPERVIADSSVLLDCLHPEDREEFEASLRNSAKDLAPWMLDFRIIDTAGKIHWMRGNSTPHRQQQDNQVRSRLGRLDDLPGGGSVEDHLHPDERDRLIPPSGMPDSRWGFPSGPISDSMW